MTDIIHRAFSF